RIQSLAVRIDKILYRRVSASGQIDGRIILAGEDLCENQIRFNLYINILRKFEVKLFSESSGSFADQRDLVFSFFLFIPDIILLIVGAAGSSPLSAKAHLPHASADSGVHNITAAAAVILYFRTFDIHDPKLTHWK